MAYFTRDLVSNLRENNKSNDKHIQILKAVNYSHPNLYSVFFMLATFFHISILKQSFEK